MKNKKRNIGIDLLRIFSMCMIIVLHIINKGVVLNELPVMSRLENEIILAFMMCSVNIYVLITAFFLEESSLIKGKKVLQIFLECWIINFFVAVGLHLLGIVKLSFPIDYIYLIFPLLSRRNWFINIYVLLYFLHPFINCFVNNITKKSYKKMILLLVCAFSIFPSVMPNRNWTFDVMEGYDIVWFVCLYIIMIYIKRYYLENNLFHISNLKLCIVNVICAFLMAFSKECIMFFWKKTGIEKIQSINNIWYTYDCLPVLIMSCVTFILFYQINKQIKEGMLSKIAIMFGTCTLGVYMIHDNFKMREVLWTEIIPVHFWGDKWWCFFLYSIIAVFVFAICSIFYIILHRLTSLLIKKINIKDIKID